MHGIHVQNPQTQSQANGHQTESMAYVLQPTNADAARQAVRDSWLLPVAEEWPTKHAVSDQQ
jgi:hypothetical protein